MTLLPIICIWRQRLHFQPTGIIRLKYRRRRGFLVDTAVFVIVKALGLRWGGGRGLFAMAEEIPKAEEDGGEEGEAADDAANNGAGVGAV